MRIRPLSAGTAQAERHGGGEQQDRHGADGREATALHTAMATAQLVGLVRRLPERATTQLDAAVAKGGTIAEWYLQR
ncbi:hypothetical protein [Nocardia amamiensis]|uniref:hypothetical protein n=1 Tax=Nocardia amamiensis TaxID=404578 RepID=UPI0033E86C2D